VGTWVMSAIEHEHRLAKAAEISYLADELLERSSCNASRETFTGEVVLQRVYSDSFLRVELEVPDEESSLSVKQRVLVSGKIAVYRLSDAPATLRCSLGEADAIHEHLKTLM